MAAELRKTGIDIVGDIPWGTHFCSFYETKEDLLDILVHYFKTGLENNEFCLWVICSLCNKEETKEALRRVISDVDQRLAAGDIEIVSHTEWFFKGGTFNSQRVIDSFQGKLSQALARGYAGMRASGDDGWLTKENWKDFSEFEERLDSSGTFYLPAGTDTITGYYAGVIGDGDMEFIVEPASVPEPTTMLLLGSGLIGLAGLWRKFKK